SAKAQELIRQQYAVVGSASRAALGEAVAALATASTNGRDVEDLLARHRTRLDLATKYVEAYRRYCWPVRSLDDYRLAPFHVMATEGSVHTDKDHVWHMTTLARLCEVGMPLLHATPYKVVDVTDPGGRA